MKKRGKYRSYGTVMDMERYRLACRGWEEKDFEAMMKWYKRKWYGANSNRLRKRYSDRCVYWSACAVIAWRHNQNNIATPDDVT